MRQRGGEGAGQRARRGAGYTGVVAKSVGGKAAPAHSLGMVTRPLRSVRLSSSSLVG